MKFKQGQNQRIERISTTHLIVDRYSKRNPGSTSNKFSRKDITDTTVKRHIEWGILLQGGSRQFCQLFGLKKLMRMTNTKVRIVTTASDWRWFIILQLKLYNILY
ncbi:hypothetical protein PAECIP111802_07265 [Paenibacillus allorhizosphaerae]|uniref:Uncharacterized protein n=1 Tax=Paenibacillus allorhizosphaerae TaxID=2849866 RepID=A0ABM8VUK9_9BACL|nr:hypothetical protein PAECIP111802_07265 [Paenibacillus allorhizosphaerae]